jgi:hypothetical protein
MDNNNGRNCIVFTVRGWVTICCHGLSTGRGVSLGVNYDAEKANCFVVSRVLSVPYRDNGGLTKSSMVLSVGKVDLLAE